MKKKLLIFCIILFFSSFFSCDKNQTDFIPNVFVDVTIRLDLPEFINLNSIGGWVYLDQANGNVAGYRGIILYRAGLNEYRAFDRACSYKPLESCHRIEVDVDNNIVINCTCGESKFDFEGNVINPPAILPLKKYQTLYNRNDNSLRVFNTQ